MKRFNKFFANLENFLNLKTAHLFIDWGTARTRIAINNKVVFDQPSLIAVHQASNATVAVGNQVNSFKARVNENITVLSPLEDGVIVDNQLAKQYLKAVFGKILTKKNRVFRLKATVAYASLLSPVERSFLRKVLGMANIEEVLLLKKAWAIYYFLKKKYKLKDICIIDVGKTSTEISLFLDDNLIKVSKIELASDSFNQELKTALQKIHQLDLAIKDIERIKAELAELTIEKSATEKKRQLVVRGKDLEEGIVKTVAVTNSDFAKPFIKLAGDFVEEIKFFLASIPSETVLTALDKGIYLTGGGSKMKGLAKFLREKLKSEVIVSENPELDLIKGLVLGSDKRE
ncbi:MAG: rod shape-determining protein [Candidatus Woesebacteria bacterium]|jgi:rod shape-determining protein MreB